MAPLFGTRFSVSCLTRSGFSFWNILCSYLHLNTPSCPHEVVQMSSEPGKPQPNLPFPTHILPSSEDIGTQHSRRVAVIQMLCSCVHTSLAVYEKFISRKVNSGIGYEPVLCPALIMSLKDFEGAEDEEPLS